MGPKQLQRVVKPVAVVLPAQSLQPADQVVGCRVGAAAVAVFPLHLGRQLVRVYGHVGGGEGDGHREAAAPVVAAQVGKGAVHVRHQLRFGLGLLQAEQVEDDVRLVHLVRVHEHEPVPTDGDVRRGRILEQVEAHLAVEGVGVATEADPVLEKAVQGLDVLRRTFPKERQRRQGRHPPVLQVLQQGNVPSQEADRRRQAEQHHQEEDQQSRRPAQGQVVGCRCGHLRSGNRGRGCRCRRARRCSRARTG